MKTQSIFMFLAFVCMNSHAQTQKGRILVGSSAYFQTNKNQVGEQKTDMKSFSISPTFGYFITHRFAIGATLSFHKGNHTTSSVITPKNLPKYTAGSVYGTTSIDYGASVRFYFLENKKFNVFLRGDLNRNFLLSTTQLSSTDPNHVENPLFPDYQERITKGFTASLEPHATYFPGKKLGVEASFGTIEYVSEKSENTIVKDADKSSHTHLRTSLHPFSKIGLIYYLR